MSSHIHRQPGTFAFRAYLTFYAEFPNSRASRFVLLRQTECCTPVFLLYT